MMWHQLQLKAAVEKHKNMVTASRAGSGAGGPSSSNAGLGAASSGSVAKKQRTNVDESITLGTWTAPQLPEVADLSVETIAFRDSTQAVMQKCFAQHLAASTERRHTKMCCVRR